MIYPVFRVRVNADCTFRFRDFPSLSPSEERSASFAFGEKRRAFCRSCATMSLAPAANVNRTLPFIERYTVRLPFPSRLLISLSFKRPVRRHREMSKSRTRALGPRKPRVISAMGTKKSSREFSAWFVSAFQQCAHCHLSFARIAVLCLVWPLGSTARCCIRCPCYARSNARFAWHSSLHFCRMHPWRASRPV